MALSDSLRKHFLDPRNVGELADATARGEASNAACGDRLVVCVRVGDGRVEDVSFRAKACSAVIATASLVTEAVRGLGLEEARCVAVDALVAEAGGLPRHKAHAVEVVRRALAAALG